MSDDRHPGHGVFSQRFGRGARQALAIHCALAQSDEWKGVAEELSDVITLTAFDLPGHGRSDDWDGQGDMLTEAAKIAASFIDEPIDLIGHSFGAVVALRLAVAAPEAVRTLTLIEPVLFAAAKGSPEWSVFREMENDLDRALEDGDSLAAAKAFTKIWSAEEWSDLSPSTRDDLAGHMHLVEASGPSLYEDSNGMLAPGVLERLEMPALFIRGEDSPPIIERITENLAARLPDVGVATIPGAEHMAPVTHVKAVAGLVRVNLDRG